ncbi:MAG: 2-oxoacid:acceptor oxidoreductase subunit alpha [Deferribacteraceae bacterium]|jgi:2-oxoglutarate ferredoxin oxidoreductase subunit alpha|nr:2-oxoacid:acceptor oxidoreductase subunit alpha [Deferribacteraceae bacterium]
MKQLLQGNDAAALGALYAGCRFFAGYPITPSTEIAEKLALLLPKHGGRFIQMEDELAAMAAVVGASVAGVKSLTATSGPGFSLKQENLGFAYITEVPCVVADVQRGGPSTGLPTAPSQSDIMQARWGTHGDHPSIALYPSTVYEQFTEMVRAFNLSERYRIPVIFLSDEIIGHMRECVTLPQEGDLEIINRTKPTVPPEDYKPYDSSRLVPPMANFGEGYRYHITGLSHDDTGFPTNNGYIAEKAAKRLQKKIDDNYDDIVKVEEFFCSDAEVIVFSVGAAARSAKEAVLAARGRGIKAGLLKALTVWPFPDRHIKSYASRLKRLVVAEMNLGQLSNEVERAAEGNIEVRRILQANGEPIAPAQILEHFSPSDRAVYV